MNAQALLEKIIELEKLKPAYREGNGVSIDSLGLLFNLNTDIITILAQELEAQGKVKILYTEGRFRKPLGLSGLIVIIG